MARPTASSGLATLISLALAGCLVQPPQTMASGNATPSATATTATSAGLPSVVPQPSAAVPSAGPQASPSATPVTRRQYELVEKEVLVLVKESGLPATEENKLKAAALGVEWSREGEVTVTARADHAGQTNVMKVKMTWTPLPTTFSEGDLLPVEFVMDVLENKSPSMGLGANMAMGVRFGPYLIGPASGNPVMADKDTPVGTQIKARVKEPLPAGGDTMVIDVLAKGEQAGGVHYFYHYQLKK